MYNLIDRDALKRDVRDVVFAVADTPLSNDAMSKLVFQMGELFRKKIDDAPGVDAVAVRHAIWRQKKMNVPKGKGQTYLMWGCSSCHNHEKKRSPYCPNCGAKMDAEVEG